MIPTPHINCKDKDLIAKTVLMPGDPLRAKFIADTFLTDVIQFNNVRNMFGYTGYYNGRKISVMGSGMGQPSIGIYSYELYKYYDVENIIRVGSTGSYVAELDVYDCVLTTSAWTESTYAFVQGGVEETTLEADKELNDKLRQIAKDLSIELKEAKVHSSDVFYRQDPNVWKKIVEETGCQCVEMESFALFANAKVLGKKAACILTVSDCFVTHEITTSEEREKSFTAMMKIALEMAE